MLFAGLNYLLLASGSVKFVTACKYFQFYFDAEKFQCHAIDLTIAIRGPGGPPARWSRDYSVDGRISAPTSRSPPSPMASVSPGLPSLFLIAPPSLGRIRALPRFTTTPPQGLV